MPGSIIKLSSHVILLTHSRPASQICLKGLCSPLTVIYPHASLNFVSVSAQLTESDIKSPKAQYQ